tara:strand:- start:946 stop:1944 length:999 start_codon:yes stop_codon:yes gene_type:complete
MTFVFIIICLNILIISKFDLIFKNINIYDYPDKNRKFHKKPMLLVGGLIVFINYLFVLLMIFFSESNQFIINLAYENSNFTWIIGPILIFLVGIYDDKKNLSGNLKFIILSFIYFIILYFDKSLILTNLEFKTTSFNINLGPYSFLFTYLCLMIFSNAFNMLDGVNLQAGIYTVVVLILFLIKIGFNYDLIIIILSMLSYLFLNYKGKTFLGDSGTYLISYIISIIFIKSYNSDRLFLCDEIFMIMILPGLELIRLFLIRGINKKNPLMPDRQHIHHLLQNKFAKISFLKISLLTNVTSFIFAIAFLIYPNLILFAMSIIFYISTIKFLKKS